MKKLFVGIALIFLDVNLFLGNGVVGLLPDFLGYFFILLGLKELEEYSDRIPDIRTYTLVALAFSALVYVLDAFGVTSLFGEVGLIIVKLMMTGAALFISNRLIFAMNDIEIALRREMNSISLMNSWRMAAIFLIFAYAMMVLPNTAGYSSVVFMAAGLFYVFTFSKSVRLFYAK